MGAQGVAPRCLSCVSELVRCFKLIRARGFNCFKLQGYSGVLIMIEFGFDFKWGFLNDWVGWAPRGWCPSECGRIGTKRVVPK